MHKNLVVEYVRPMIGDVVNSVGVALGVLDADGTLVQGNTAWCAEGAKRQIPLVLQSAFGKNCLFELRSITTRQDNTAQLLNGIESVWAVIKRGVYGVYHQISDKHTDRYVNEFSFRLNEGNVQVPTVQRLGSILKGAVGKRLTYKELTA